MAVERGSAQDPTVSRPVARLEGLEIPFGSAPGLHDITLAVDAGRCVAVVGTSGVGKSTLLRAIAGLAPLRAGRIEIAGRDVTALPPERRGAVYLHQSPVLFPHLDVAGNVAFPLHIRGMGRDAVRTRVAEALARMRLDDFGPRRAGTLSGGQRHRVALARALVADAPLLLLDEPLSALDAALRSEVRDAIATVRDDGRHGLLLVTHELDDAAVLASTVCVLLEGGIAQTASPAELFSRPASLAVARLVGVPNLIEGRVSDELFTCQLGVWPAPGEVDGRFTAALRADAFCRAANGCNAEIVEVRQLARGPVVIVSAGGVRLEVAMDGENRLEAGHSIRLGVRPNRVHYLRG